MGGGRVGLTPQAAAPARPVREEQKPSRSGKARCSDSLWVNETVLEAAGLRPALSGTADTMPFQATPGRAENTGYHANQTRINSLRYELRKTSGQISSALKHLRKLSAPDVVWLVMTTRHSAGWSGPLHTVGGMSQQQVSGDNAATPGQGLTCSGGWR